MVARAAPTETPDTSPGPSPGLGPRAVLAIGFLVIDAVAIGVLVALGGLGVRVLLLALGATVVLTLVALRLLSMPARTRRPRAERAPWVPPAWLRTVVFVSAVVTIASLGLVVALADDPVTSAGLVTALGVGVVVVATLAARLVPARAPEGDAHGPHVAADRGAGLGAVGIAALVLADIAAVAIGVALGPGVTQKSLVVVVALVAGAALAVLAATRFWQMLVILFLVRSSLDWFKAGPLAGSGLDPSTAVGGVFLLAALLWLLAQRRAGRLVPLSRSAWAFLAFSGACMVSSFGARVPVESFQNSLKVLSSAAMLIVLEQVFHRREDRIRPLLLVAFLSLVVPTLVGVVEWMGSEPETGYNAVAVGRVQSTFVHPNAFATYLVMMAALAVALRPHVRGVSRRWLDLALLATLGMIVVTYTRSAWLALAVGVFYVGIRQDKRLLWGMLAALVVVVVAVPSVATRLADLDQSESVPGQVEPNSLSWRIGYWGDVLPYWTESPVTGIGLNMVQETAAIGLPPHNVFVQAFVETGLFGFFALVVLLVALAADLRLGLRRASPGLERGIAIGAIAMGLTLLVQAPSENLLTQAVSQWYFLGAAAWVTALATRARLAEQAVETASPPALAV